MLDNNNSTNINALQKQVEELTTQLESVNKRYDDSSNEVKTNLMPKISYLEEANKVARDHDYLLQLAESDKEMAEKIVTNEYGYASLDEALLEVKGEEPKTEVSNSNISEAEIENIVNQKLMNREQEALTSQVSKTEEDFFNSIPEQNREEFKKEYLSLKGDSNFDLNSAKTQLNNAKILFEHKLGANNNASQYYGGLGQTVVGGDTQSNQIPEYVLLGKSLGYSDEQLGWDSTSKRLI